MYTPTCPFWESGESKIVMKLQVEGRAYRVNQSTFSLSPNARATGRPFWNTIMIIITTINSNHYVNASGNCNSTRKLSVLGHHCATLWSQRNTCFFPWSKSVAFSFPPHFYGMLFGRITWESHCQEGLWMGDNGYRSRKHIARTEKQQVPEV